jgi:hypothetical protein
MCTPKQVIEPIEEGDEILNPVITPEGTLGVAGFENSSDRVIDLRAGRGVTEH